MDIILFKAVKQLNIGIATAVEELEKGGFNVENKPTAKLSSEAYDYLLMKFGQNEKNARNYFSKKEEITSYELLLKARREKGIPTSIFKYFSSKKHCISSLRDHYLYHSIYSGFNDPFDCNLNLVQFNKGKAEFNDTKLKFKKRLDQTGICCFSTVKDSILMWSHYAGNHSGFCLEFQSNQSLNGINPLNVIYKNEYKVANYHKHREDASYHLIYSKSECWSYENELRTLITGVSKEEDRLVPFAKKDLLSVYLGVSCSAEHEAEIKDIIQNVYDCKVQLFKGELSSHSFELVWKKIETKK